MSIQTTRLRTPGGTVRVRYLECVGDAAVRVDVAADRRWRLDIDLLTEAVDVLFSYNAAGELADVPLPDWIDTVIGHLQVRCA